MVLDARHLGLRVAEARQRAGLTQSELARSVGLDRSSLAKIETGARRVTALELAQVAEALDERIEWFVEEAPPAIVSHRNVTDPGEPSPRIDREVELRARAVEFVSRHDPMLRKALDRLPVFSVPADKEEAEQLAHEARMLLGAEAEGPLKELGARVVRAGLVPFVADLGTESADAASVLLEAGAVAVVNGGLRVGRRRLSLAHELGHVLMADEYTVDWRIDGASTPDLREQLIDRFARALLLPESSFRDAWDRWLADKGARAAAVMAASCFRVDMSTLARRLLELEMVEGTQAAQVRTTRTTRADIVEHDLVVSDELGSGWLPRDYEAAVLRLFRSERVSGARALELLFGTWDAADLPELPQRNASAIWDFVS
ncbi:helix-turn-helix domain-containing protein [Nocardiopsis algeriensis]|uniref:Zn-dependent peptidase ImmA (M78 family)/DNA-binding XRE family transcriptional regulator n=1 Tax=Nocardiopsis algeriensis TaxID=1478215 RepID=A0A841II44_9ACTN|nr:XRE family transcriptional regulator [Nocardiopsis algeriensis]MBB6118439.1 Zn-dependent peptidase ImmA (M78 family)/DNA-binding XRE family transcriptional regulator [Nocardiopsis algeriensis]